uniref:Nucleolar protein 4 n=1 Tax=Anopheles farauti TaxID=69004 RepID=A0A182QMT4_9DIPT
MTGGVGGMLPIFDKPSNQLDQFQIIVLAGCFKRDSPPKLQDDRVLFSVQNFSSTTSSLAKVSRLSRGHDTSDQDAGYDDDDDEEEEEQYGDDEEEEDEDEEENDGEEDRETVEEEELPTAMDVPHRDLAQRSGVRALEASRSGGGNCGEKNDEKTTPHETADLNAAQQQQQLRHKRPKYDYTRDQMFEIFQPWVIRTYGDRAKTKTITLKKQARIIKTLRGLEMNNPDSSKFRFWVKTKGFTTSKPGNFQDIFTHQNIPENDGCMLYAPSGGLEPGQPYKKVAVVENFFDIIYGVHVSLGSRATRHAGQKRTYRTITETYAFLPREAVTKFLSLCSQCSKLTTKVYSPKSELRADDPVAPNSALSERVSSTSVDVESKSAKVLDRRQSSLRYYELLKNLYKNGRSNGGTRSAVDHQSIGVGKLTNPTSTGAEVSSSPASVRTVRPASAVSEVHSGDVCASETTRTTGARNHPGFNNNCSEKGVDEKRKTVPITSTYLGVTRSFGLEDDDALNMVSLFYYFYGYFSMQRLYDR